MSAHDFLVELGTEELPPKTLKNLGQAFLGGVEKGLKAAGLNYSSARIYAAPRRLAVLVEQLASQQPDRSVNLDGPPVQAAFDKEGNPTQAALGFAKKCGVELAQIDASGAKLKFSQTIAGQPAASLLPGIVETALNELPIAKRMRWGARKTEFVRPTQWLVMLFGDAVIDCEILAQKAGRLSRGHRFHHPDQVRISSPANYLEDLRSAYVLADLNERRALISERVAELAAEQQGTAIVPADLLDEVSSLVEWPVPLVCSFEERFLEVPQEALITTMQDNQKYFCLLDAHGKLLPRFITVANVESKDPAQIISGNEKVVRPRLTDAEFFFKQDKKHSLESLNQRLANVVFQAQLGSVFDKAQRVSALAGFIATRIGGDATRAARAGLLSKCDLASEMVGEFPEMQGIAGYYYAKHDGEADDVALALNEQYMPRGAGAELPQTLTGAAVAVADKLDTLVGIFGIGMLPTGSKDPYALRRAALGVLRILIENDLRLSLRDAIYEAINLYGGKLSSSNVMIYDQLNKFFLERLRVRYEEQGVNHQIFYTILPTGACIALSPRDFNKRVLAVQAFLALPEAQDLVAANKRAANILKSPDAPENINQLNDDPSLYVEAAEHALGSALNAAWRDTTPLMNSEDYVGVLQRAAEVHHEVNTFFETVLVNTEDAGVRTNRYALLARFRGLFSGVADISLLG